MKHRKKTALILVMTLLIMLLSACATPADDGKTEPENTASPSGTAENQPSTPEPVTEAVYFPLENPVSLSMWCTWPHEQTSYFNEINEFPAYIELERQTNVIIEFLSASQAGQSEAYTVMSAGGDFADLVKNAAQLHPGGISQALDDELYYDLADYLADYLPNYKSYLDSDPDYSKGVADDDGRIGAAYTLRSEDLPRVGPSIRKDWLDEVGMDIPVTYDDYYNVLTAFKVQLGKEGALSIFDSGVPYNDYLIAGFDISGYVGGLASYGAGLFCVWGDEVVFTPYTENFKEYVTMLNQWYSEKLIYQDFISAIKTPMNEEDMVFAGELGIAYTAAYSLFSYEPDEEGFMLVGIPDAKKTADQKLHIRNGGNKVMSNSSISISANAADQLEVAARWLDYWYSDAGVMLGNYGIAGVTYEFDASGEPYLTDFVLSNPDGLTMSQFSSGYGGNSFQTGYTLTTKGFNAATSQAVEDALSYWSEADTDYLYPKMATMTREESDIFVNYYGDILTYVVENIPAFIIGINSLDEWDSFIETLKTMHVEECLAAKQSSFDRYQQR